MIGFKYILLLAVAANHLEAAILPSYVDKCCLDDSLNDCIKESANRAIKSVALGDNFYNTPGYFPLRIPKFEVLSNDQGFFTVANVRIYGFPLGVVTSIDVDIATATYRARYYFEKLVIEAYYDMLIYVGINNAPISGFGSTQITLRNVTVDHSFHVQADNDGYARIRNPTANYTSQSTTYKMENIDSSSNVYLNTISSTLSVLFRSQVNKAFSDVLSWPYIAIGDKVKLTDVVDFSCPGTTTTTGITTPTTLTYPAYNITLPLSTPSILTVPPIL